MKDHLTLLDELEQIDAALIEGTASEEQIKRGQEMVHLADAAPHLFLALENLFNILHDYECSLRKGYIEVGLQMAADALALAKGAGV